MGKGGSVRGREGAEGERLTGVDLDICPGAPVFLVTPLGKATRYNRSSNLVRTMSVQLV